MATTKVARSSTTTTEEARPATTYTDEARIRVGKLTGEFGIGTFGHARFGQVPHGYETRTKRERLNKM